jgi:uncharacterized protein YdhG (YjbR/CyaY superfamily)
VRIWGIPPASGTWGRQGWTLVQLDAAVTLDGAVIYYAPFAHHIGIYPPVKGDASLEKALAPYRGEKGNLRFPIDVPMPYPLIRRVVQARLSEHRARLASKKR